MKYIAFDKQNRDGYLFDDYFEAKRFRRACHYRLKLRAFDKAEYRLERKCRGKEAYISFATYDEAINYVNEHISNPTEAENRAGEWKRSATSYKLFISVLDIYTGKSKQHFNAVAKPADYYAKQKRVITKKQKRLALWLVPANILIILGVLWIANADWQLIADERAARNYTPSSEIAKIASELGLTKKGKAVFYATHPELQTSAEFNKICGNDGGEHYTQGCYYRDSKNKEHIYVYHPGIDSLDENGLVFSYYDNRKIVALHELLHAVYDRLDSKKQSETCNNLRTIASNIPELNEELSMYSSSQYCTEAFARYGSEYVVGFNTQYSSLKDTWNNLGKESRALAKNLLPLYKIYFDCSKYNIAYAYWNNKSRLTSFKNYIDDLDASLASESSAIDSLKSDYYRYPTRRKMNEINSRVSSYNTKVVRYHSLLDTYNKVGMNLDSEEQARTRSSL